VDSEPATGGAETDLLDGVDTSLRGLLRFVAGEEARAAFLPGDLDALQAQIDAAQAAFDFRAPDKALPALTGGLDVLRKLVVRVRQTILPVRVRLELAARLDQKEKELLEALALAQGWSRGAHRRRGVVRMSFGGGDLEPGGSAVSSTRSPSRAAGKGQRTR
jgi:hypothetical protein